MMDGDRKDRTDFVSATQCYYLLAAGNGISQQQQLEARNSTHTVATVDTARSIAMENGKIQAGKQQEEGVVVCGFSYFSTSTAFS